MLLLLEQHNFEICKVFDFFDKSKNYEILAKIVKIAHSAMTQKNETEFYK